MLPAIINTPASGSSVRLDQCGGFPFVDRFFLKTKMLLSSRLFSNFSPCHENVSAYVAFACSNSVSKTLCDTLTFNPIKKNGENHRKKRTEKSIYENGNRFKWIKTYFRQFPLEKHLPIDSWKRLCCFRLKYSHQQTSTVRKTIESCSNRVHWWLCIHHLNWRWNDVN